MKSPTMLPSRLDALADGIFAIVMTILVLEMRAPELTEISNHALAESLRSYGPLVMSYFLSFAVLFTYWRAHHYIMGLYAKTVDVWLSNINAIFFLFVALIPFSSALLGLYHETQVAIVVYSANIVLIGLSLWWMRHHVLFTDHVKSMNLPKKDIRHGTMRTVLPVLFALIAVPLSFWNTNVSLTLLTAAVLFNLLPGTTDFLDKILDVTQ